jgi:hypothetical protein
MSPFIVPVVLFISLPVTIIGTMMARAYMRQVELQGRSSGGLAPELAERLDRMEQAIDAVAVEVERISEAQRFTTRVLTERTEPGNRLEGARAAGGAR